MIVALTALGIRFAFGVHVARAERAGLAGLLVERVTPDATGVVGEQVDRYRRLGRGRPHPVNVIALLPPAVIAANAGSSGVPLPASMMSRLQSHLM